MHSLSDFVLAAAKKRERQSCYCKALSRALERGVARACLAGRRRRRQPPREAAERALDAGRLQKHTAPAETTPNASRKHRRSAARRAWSQAVADASRRDGAAKRWTRDETCSHTPPPRERTRTQLTPPPPTAAAHSVKQEPQEARLRVGGPRPHRQAPQASWGKR